MDRRAMKPRGAWAGIGLRDCPSSIWNKQCFSNWCLPVHSCGCLEEAQENVFTALGNYVMRIMCTLNVEGATPGTHLTRGRDVGKEPMFFGPSPFYEKMPIKTNRSTQTKQQHQIPQSPGCRQGFLNKRFSNASSQESQGRKMPPPEGKGCFTSASDASPQGLSCYLPNEKQAL